MYLIAKDYQRIIQATELNAITGSDPSIRTLMEGSVEKEIRSYLIQKYDLTLEFQDTAVFSMTVIYKASNRVYLDAAAYDATRVYAANDLTLQSGNVYKSIAGNAAHAFNVTEWTLLGVQNNIFYVNYPFPVFDQDKFYKKGDQIFWKDKTYTAQRDSVIISHEDELQALDIESIRRGNVFPDDVNGLNMWGTGVAYSIPAGTLPTDTTKWTNGDNRNQYFVKCYMAMVVYELCARIAPNNVPEARHNNWLGAIKSLKDYAKGDLTAELPVIQPKQGSPIRHGGNVARINNVF